MFSRKILSCRRQLGTPSCTDPLGITTQRAGLKFVAPPPVYDLEIPPDSRGKKLPVYPKVPQYPPTIRPFKMQKKLRLMRGEETVLNKLVHKQYGIIALIGGRLKWNHFEMMRWTTNKYLPKEAFALYRVDPPWQPVTKKGAGQRMGGGKGAIDHYVTPIKARRVILEVGGPVEYDHVKKAIEGIARILPFKAMAVSQSTLEELYENEKYIEENNENPFTFKYIIQNNLGGCHNWIAPIDKYWYGKHR